MPSAKWWKGFYAAERHRLGVRGLMRMLDLAPGIALPRGGSLVFPHAKLEGCGGQIAVAANAVIASGADTVLALGVLHGGREADADEVKRARGGDAEARRRLRGIHGNEGLAAEEFSLDNFGALLLLAAQRAGRPAPRVVARYAFLVDGEPESLAGLDELRELRRAGCAIVATADHVHHGAGYGTPDAERLPREDARAETFARAAIDAACAALAHGDGGAFAQACADAKSDFRDNGPVLGALLDRPWRHRIEALTLVDYAADLGSEPPTWVAAALLSLAAV